MQRRRGGEGGRGSELGVGRDQWRDNRWGGERE